MIGFRKSASMWVGVLAATGVAVANACPPEIRVISRVAHVQPVETVVVSRVESPVVVKRFVVQQTQQTTTTTVATPAPAPQPAAPAPQTVPAGALLALKVRFAGTEPGAVYLRVQGIALGTKLEGWSQGLVTFRLPAELEPVEQASLPATIEAYAADGRLLKKLAVAIVAGDDLSEVQPAPTTVGMAEPTAAAY